MNLFFINQTTYLEVSRPFVEKSGTFPAFQKTKAITNSKECRIVRTDFQNACLIWISQCVHFWCRDEPRTNTPKRVIPLASAAYICIIQSAEGLPTFQHCPGFKTVGAWIKNSLFSLWSLFWTVPRYFKKLHDALTDMNENISTCSLAV